MNHSSKTYTTIISLLIALLVLSSASLAWFSISSRVDVSDLSMSVTAPSSIYIADGNVAKSSLEASDWNSTIDMSSRDKRVKGNLLLASSVSGYNDSFFYTDTATAAGEPTGTFKRGRTSISALTDDGASGYYADVPFWIKTDSAEIQYLKLNTEESTISISSSDRTNIGGLVLATRVAFLNIEGTGPSTGSDPLIFVHSEYSDRNMFHPPVISASAASSSGTYGSDITPLAGAEQVIGVTNVPKQFLVRVWIEGNDKSAILGSITTGGEVDEAKLHISVTLALTK